MERTVAPLHCVQSCLRSVMPIYETAYQWKRGYEKTYQAISTDLKAQEKLWWKLLPDMHEYVTIGLQIFVNIKCSKNSRALLSSLKPEIGSEATVFTLLPTHESNAACQSDLIVRHRRTKPNKKTLHSHYKHVNKNTSERKLYKDISPISFSFVIHYFYKIKLR